ncbi:MAG: oligosaccharide flippase family protein [Candidatus Nealsonbacteria bacterium]|nr:oligosaccharide flippase family protein [Candidatus Nealsonbacteria bacterium]
MSNSDIITKLRQRLRSEFFRNTFLVMSGTAFAQVIAVAVSPIITRLYTPADFGAFGVYMSVVSVAVAVSTLRFDQALMLPKRDEDAANLLGLSWLAVIAVAGLTALICIPCRHRIAALVELPAFARWVWLIPLSVFLSGTYLCLTAWSTRQKQFRPAAAAHVARATAAATCKCAGGAMHAGTFGLIVGEIIGATCASLVLGLRLLKWHGASVRRALRLSRMKELAREYSDFPLYGSTEIGLVALSQNIPTLLLAYFFGMDVAGYYVLGTRVIQLPANVLLTSLRQVLFQKLSEVHNSGGDTYRLFKAATLALLTMGFVGFSIMVLFGPAMFSFVFGSQWNIAGEYSQWLALWLAILFVNLPAVLFSKIYRKQRAILVFGVVLIACRAGALIFGGTYLSPLRTVALFSIVGAVLNAYLIVWMWGVVRRASAEATSRRSQEPPQDSHDGTSEREEVS